MSKRKETKYIVIHCSATKPSMDIGKAEIDKWHRERGWNGIGYHFVIRRNGQGEIGRQRDEVGAHAVGYNHNSVSVCLIGGIGEDGKPENNFTEDQMKSLAVLVNYLFHKYPDAKVVGHRDLSPDKNKDGKITPDEWLKDCPCFDVGAWAAENGFVR